MGEVTFVDDEWTPNYVSFKDMYTKSHDTLSDMFLAYIEGFVTPFKQGNQVYISFDFGDKKVDLPCAKVEELLYELKQNEGNTKSDVQVAPKELADFFGYFHLIEKTKEGYLMVEESIKKAGNASFATLLGHILVEKHFSA